MSFKLIWKMQLCVYGFFVWHRLIKKYTSIQNTMVVLLPDCDDQGNYFAMLYLNQLLIKEKRDNAIIITRDSRVVESAKLFCRHISEIFFWDQRKINALIQYALLYQFDSRFKIAALDIPVGRNGSRLIGLNNMTAEEIFAIGVYNLYPFQKEVRIEWRGSVFENV